MQSQGDCSHRCDSGNWLITLRRTLFGSIPTINAAGCEALQHLAEMIPTFCYTYPGLEHMEEMEMSSVGWMNCLLMLVYVC